MLATPVTYRDLLELRSHVIAIKVRLGFALTEPSGRMMLADIRRAEQSAVEALAKIGAAINTVENDTLTPA